MSRVAAIFHLYFPYINLSRIQDSNSVQPTNTAEMQWPRGIIRQSF